MSDIISRLYVLEQQREDGSWKREHSCFGNIAGAALHADALGKLDGIKRRIIESTYGDNLDNPAIVPDDIAKKHLKDYLDKRFPRPV